MHIFAIEIIEDQVFGEEFTQPLREKFEQIIEEIHKNVSELLKMLDNRGLPPNHSFSSNQE